uniref:Uncharacterized protein n=1 Tax=Rhizophora mucronata TaxID=61149 RepID=A0A2P2M1J0_RHIMU
MMRNIEYFGSFMSSNLRGVPSWPKLWSSLQFRSPSPNPRECFGYVSCSKFVLSPLFPAHCGKVKNV